MFLELSVASCSYGCVQLHVRYVNLSASNGPDSGLEGKGAGDHWRPLMSLAVVGVNHFTLLHSGVHS
jgi:hypothetical protein